jgi:predicted MFS family arabinose efflux permease
MITRTIRTVASLDRNLRTLFFTTLIFRAGTMAYPFLSAYLLLARDLDRGAVGRIVAAFGVGALCADLFAGVVLGRIGARTAMLTGLLLNAAVLAVTPFLHAIPAIVAAVLVWGFAYELFTPASYSATIAGSAEEGRKVAFSCNRLAINLGMGLGPAIGGVIFGVEPVALFWVNGLLVLAAAGFLFQRTRTSGQRPERVRPVEDATTKRSRLVAATARDETRFWTIFGLSIPIQLAFSLPAVFASTYIIVGLGLPSYWVGVVFTVNALAIVLFEVPLNAAMAGIAHLPGLLIGYGLTGAGFLLMGVSHAWPLLILSTLVWTAGEMVVFPGLLTYVSSLSGPDISDRNMSFYSAGVNIAFIATPQLALLLSSPQTPELPWIAAGTAVCLAFLLLLAARTNPYTWTIP